MPEEKEEEFIHILIETFSGHEAPVKMRELKLNELQEGLKNKTIYLCTDRHPLFLLKNNEIYPVESVCKIYHPNIGRNATFN